MVAALKFFVTVQTNADSDEDGSSSDDVSTSNWVFLTKIILLVRVYLRFIGYSQCQGCNASE